jgi:hypothetical protein
MSGLKAPINICYRITTSIDNPSIPRIASCIYLYNPLFSCVALSQLRTGYSIANSQVTGRGLID